MTASEIRTQARKSLTGKWGKAALATLIFGVINYIIGFVLGLVPVVGSIVASIISLPLSFGFTVVVMTKIKRGEDFTYLEFFSNGFNNFVKVWQATLWILVKIILPLVIAIVAAIIMVVGFSMSAAGNGFGIVLGIIGLIGYIAGLIWTAVKSYLYKLSLYIMNDNPDMSAKEAVEKSAELMNGHRWSYFWLQLSFIGWIILGALVCGIGMFWVLPYMQVATVAFYDELAGNKETKVEEPEENNPISE